MPASTTDPEVGASTCASGNQICAGTTGTFTAKATKSSGQSKRCSAKVKSCACKTCAFVVPNSEYTYRIPKSIKIEPNKV